MKEIEAVLRLVEMLEDLPQGDRWMLYTLQRRAEITVSAIFGPSSPYLEQLSVIPFFPWVGGDQGDTEEIVWARGREQMQGLLLGMLEDLRQSSQRKEEESSKGSDLGSPGQIFLAHGLDHAMEKAVLRTLDRLGLEPLFLHGKTPGGETVAEDIDRYDHVRSAIVLLSQEDREGACPEVVLELDWLLKRLGKERVMILYGGASSLPSQEDATVSYTNYDDSGRWQFDLVKQLKAWGYMIDANRVL